MSPVAEILALLKVYSKIGCFLYSFDSIIKRGFETSVRLLPHKKQHLRNISSAENLR